MRRGWAVTIVFLGLLAVFTLIGMVVIPLVAAEATELADRAPGMLDDLLRNPWVQDLDQRYQVIQRIQEEINRRVADGNLWAGIFGGVLDAGRIIASGVFSILTVLVLTLYLLASLPSVKQAAYARAGQPPPPLHLAAEEIMRRVGSYAIGQVAVAATNAFCAWIMMSLLDVLYAAVLAVAVGVLDGLIPMVGATLGAAVVALVAFFDEPQKALIVIIYFIVPAVGELRRDAADHAADRGGAGCSHRGRALVGGTSSGSSVPCWPSGRRRGPAHLRGSPRPDSSNSDLPLASTMPYAAGPAPPASSAGRAQR